MSLMLFCLLGRAFDTNTVYPIDDGTLVMQNAKGEIELNQQKLENAKRVKECFPASEFPEGNWGAIAEGLQLSLRFETNEFISGSPIPAIIIIRNVTNSIQTYHAFKLLGRTSPVSVVVTDINGTNLSLKSENLTVVASRNIRLFPGTEQKFSERIDNLYNFSTNGPVNVFAMLRIGHRGSVELKSGKVSILIR